MYLFRYNYRLIGKRLLCFVPSTPEEIETYGEDGEIPVTDCFFAFSITDNCDPNMVEGVGTEEFSFRDTVADYEDIEVGKDYLLVVKDDYILFFKELTDKDKEKGYYGASYEKPSTVNLSEI